MLLTCVALSAFADPRVAIVVVDEEARDHGFRLALEGTVVDDALPVDVEDGEHVHVVDPDGARHELDVAPGEAWEVAGPKGEAWMAQIGADVRSDVVLVRGDAAVIAALAEELGADLHTVGADHWLVRDEVLFDVPWAETEGLERLKGVGLVRADAEVPPAPTSDLPTLRTTLPRPAVRAAPVAVVAPAAVVAVQPPAAPAPVTPPKVAEEPRSEASVVAEDGGREPAAEVRRVEMDPARYVGLYLCGDETVLRLSPGGSFAGGGKSGQWYVSSPGVVRLTRGGADVGRAAIEVDRHFCRDVW